MRQLALYVMEGCPYCRLVENHLVDRGLDIPIVDILGDPAAFRYLREKGGRVQAPCLFIDEKPLYESQEIIKWLKAMPEEEGQEKAEKP